MSGLLAKSLVMGDEAANPTRYRLLETVREYGRDRLIEAGETPSRRDRHLAYCRDLVEQAEAALNGPEQTLWLERLTAEYDDKWSM